MFRITWTKYLRKKKVLRRIKTKRKLLAMIRRKKKTVNFWRMYTEERVPGEFNIH